MDGFLIVNKEKGYTSFDCCNKIKHKFKISKVGHTGTLDPNATGVLVIALGRATKALPLLEEHTKEYLATVRFGAKSDTLDIDGNIEVTNIGYKPDINKIKETLNILKEKETQLPPLYSAIKVNGKKLYEYARENKEVEIKEKSIKIYDLDLASDLYLSDGFYHIKLKMKVSKGFYVRSLIRDLGEIINCDTLMSDLVRLSSGDFKIEDSKLIDDITESDLIPLIKPFDKLERLDIKEYLYKLVLNGITLDERQIKTDKMFIVRYNGKDLAIYEPIDKYKYKVKLFLI